MHNYPYVKTYHSCSLKTILKILGNVTYPKVFESNLVSLFQREIPTASEELLHDRAIPGAQVRVRLCPVLLPLQEDRELQADAAQASKDRRQPAVSPRQPADRRGDCARHTGCCHSPNG